MNYDEKQSYITHVRNMILKNQRHEIPREFLETFLDTIQNNEENEFPISLEEVSAWLGYTKGNLRRLITEDYARNSIYYKEDEDYIIQEGKSKNNHKTIDIMMTIECFKDLCLRVDSPRGKQVRKYFMLVEDAYKEYYDRYYSRRLESEDPRISKKKEYEENDSPELKYGSVFYYDEIDQIDPLTGKELKVGKVGETKQIPIRFSQLQNEYAGNHKLKIVYPTKYRKSLQDCVLENSQEWVLPCSKPPCPKEVMFREDYPYEEIFEICKKHIEGAGKEIEKLKESKNKPDLSKPSHFTFKRKGKMHILQ